MMWNDFINNEPEITSQICFRCEALWMKRKTFRNDLPVNGTYTNILPEMGYNRYLL